VATVTELVLRERGPDIVLASLARAGTPVGVLLRRWARHAHGLDLPHYAVSIVRGRGIDPLALRHLAEHHDPSRVVFVDGWTGKGAISVELATALAEHERATGVRFDPDLAVLADPGRCATTFGTRDDWLIASACLNSTVSGLVSRTVLNRRLLAPTQYHGAKFYAELAPADVSNDFLDTVTAQFPGIGDVPPPSDRVAEFSGRAAVEKIVDAYRLGDANLVKPGVGETTRVLLRRVPWRVLVRTGAPPADLAHVRLLAQRRGVPVEEVPDLPYSCVGLIHPRYTRGATGADGLAAAAQARGPERSGGT
jgi:phosphoribosyl transferase-like protein/RNA binding Pelota-like protein